MLVAQDWGGPIGLRAMADRDATRLRGIVLGNTAVGPPRRGFKPTLFHRLAQPAGRRATCCSAGSAFRSARCICRKAIARASAATSRAPIAGRCARVRDRAAPLALARMVPDSPTHPSVAALARCRGAVSHGARCPIAIVWGDRDPVLGRVSSHLERLRPDASVVRTDAGHFLQEEVPDELADAILDVVGRANWAS